MTITSSMNTFSNTGNIPTLHQPTVTFTTVTHTHWCPIHITCLKFLWFWFGGIYSCLSTHTTYCKTLGMNTVHPNGIMYQAMVAKREMKEKNDGDLGSWKRAVTTADGTWQTRGWHSKNATFSYTTTTSARGDMGVCLP